LGEEGIVVEWGFDSEVEAGNGGQGRARDKCATGYGIGSLKFASSRKTDLASAGAI
jgi:hypothetical protein